MVSIAYVDHSFHRKTKSTRFLSDILLKRGHTVSYFWDEAWQGGPPIEWAAVSSYDVVIMFQSYCPSERLHFRRAHPNVIYIPMLDQFGLWRGPMSNLSAFWEPFQGSKVLNFSNALHCMTVSFGIASHFVRYYQPVPDLPLPPRQGLHGFFWIRREELSWQIIRKLIANSQFESLQIHLATDPGSPPPRLPRPDDVSRHNITISTWFENKADFESQIARANVFFAPRPEEGIGQSFLEAMARGQCVVAPNHGTMNEYILPGVNGLLFDIRNPVPLDFADVTELGRQARKTALYGRVLWERSEDELVNFILTPSKEFYANRYQHPALSAVAAVSPRTALPVATLLRGNPLMGALYRAADRYSGLRSIRFIWRQVKNMARRLTGAV